MPPRDAACDAGRLANHTTPARIARHSAIETQGAPLPLGSGDDAEIIEECVRLPAGRKREKPAASPESSRGSSTCAAIPGHRHLDFSNSGPGKTQLGCEYREGKTR